MTGRNYIGVGLLLVVAVGVFTVHKPDRSPPPESPSSQPAAPANAIKFSIANAATKQVWMQQAVRDFNAKSASDSDLQVNGKPIVVEDIQDFAEELEQLVSRIGDEVSFTASEVDESGQVAVRNRKHADQGVKSVDDFLAEIQKLIAAKTPFE